MIKRFWHVGFGVENLERAIKDYEALGFEVVQRFEKSQPKSIAAHMNHSNGASIELFQFFDKTHPQVEYIKQHMAFESDNLDEDLANLESKGWEIVIPKTSGTSVKFFAFLRDPNEQNIELAEK